MKDSSLRPVILILGKLPPPHYGPSIATKLLLESSLSDSYALKHVNTGTHKSLSTLGKFRIRGFIGNMFIYIKYSRELIKWRPNIVLVPLSQTSMGILKDGIFVIIGAMFRSNVVVILRGSEIREWFENTSGWMKRYYTIITKRMHAVLVLSDRLHYLFEDFLPTKNILTVTNGADYALPNRFEHGERVTNIAYLSNLQASKGIEDLIEATRILRARNKAFKLEVAGYWLEETTKNRCDSIVSENKLPVKFYSALTESAMKLQFLVDADIFVFVPRRPEGQPWAVIEALAAGLPVIATDQGAICDMVKDNENGFIVNTNSPEEIADRLSQLIDDSSLRRNMGERSRKIYELNYTELHMVQSFQRAFELVLEY